MTAGTEGMTLETAQAARDTAVRELQDFKDRTARLIVREATEHGYEGQIDGWLRELGLTRPVERFQVEWRKTLTEYTEAEGATQYEVERNAINGRGRPEGDGWSVFRVRRARL